MYKLQGFQRERDAADTLFREIIEENIADPKLIQTNMKLYPTGLFRFGGISTSDSIKGTELMEEQRANS